VEVKEKPAETKKTKAATKKAEVAAPKRRRKRDMVKSFIKMRILDLILLTVNDEKGMNKIAGRFPTKYQTTFIELFDSYRTQLAIKHSGDNEKALKEAVQIFKVLVRAYARQLDNPHEFASTHYSVRSPFDYYYMAQAYVGALIDYDRSIVGGIKNFDTAKAQIDAGENVVLFANHQSEADAAFLTLMTEESHPGFGYSCRYVAGDRVVNDLMAKPFSMGRNLFCINSKKHINDVPELRSAKMKQNIKTVKEMEQKLKEGGQLIWIAPHGGRDRRAADGTLVPGEFDKDAVALMTKLALKAGAGGTKTHFYPFSMATYDLMPPPSGLEKSLGEKRVVNYTGCGIALAEEIDLSPEAVKARAGAKADLEKDELAVETAKQVYDAVCKLYTTIEGCTGTGSEFPLPEGAARPWKDATA